MNIFFVEIFFGIVYKLNKAK